MAEDIYAKFSAGIGETIDIYKNEDNFSKCSAIESVLLYGNPDVPEGAILTICIPIYDAPPFYLKRALESVVHQKTEAPYRIVVIDNEADPNKTESFDIVKSFNKPNITYYKNKENIGGEGNFNRCGLLAKTEYFTTLHGDDYLKENYIEKIMPYLKKGKIDLVLFDYEFVSEKNNNEERQSGVKRSYSMMALFYKLLTIMFRPYHIFHNIFNIKYSKTIILFVNLVRGCLYHCCGIVCKRDTFIKSGGWDKKYGPAEDWRFLLFYSLNYNYIFIKDKLIYKEMSVGESSRMESVVKEKQKILQTALIKSFVKENRMCALYYKIFYKDFQKWEKSRYLSVGGCNIVFKLMYHVMNGWFFAIGH